MASSVPTVRSLPKCPQQVTKWLKVDNLSQLADCLVKPAPLYNFRLSRLEKSRFICIIQKLFVPLQAKRNEQ
jgi:hypothetical protein